MSTNKTHSTSCYSAAVSLLAAAALLFLDLLTKNAAMRLLDGRRAVLIPNVLVLTFLQNDGGAFGILDGKIIFFIIFTFLCLIFLTRGLIRMPAVRYYLPMRILFIVLIAGAAGNLVDRIRYASVRDFIYLECIDFPVFNVADIYVTCSIAIFALLYLLHYKDEDLQFLGFKGNQDE